MVTHPCINRAHDCLTSVIKRKMFSPCYVSPQVPIATPQPKQMVPEQPLPQVLSVPMPMPLPHPIPDQPIPY